MILVIFILNLYDPEWKLYVYNRFNYEMTHAGLLNTTSQLLTLPRKIDEFFTPRLSRSVIKQQTFTEH